MQTKKTVRITVRVSPEEAKQIAEGAAKNNMTPSSYLRLMANQKPNDYPEIQTHLKKLINEVNHIGVNINQIVKNHNASYYSAGDKERLFAYMKKLNVTVKEVVAAIGNK